MPFAGQVFIAAVFMLIVFMMFAHFAVNSSKTSTKQINAGLALLAIANFFILCYLYSRMQDI